MAMRWAERRWNRWLGSSLIALGLGAATVGCGGGSNEPLTAKSSRYQAGEGGDATADPGAAGAEGGREASKNGKSNEPSSEQPPPKGSGKPSPRPPSEVAEGTPKKSGAGRGAPSGGAPAEATGRTEIPDGPPEELIELLAKMEQDGPPGRNDAEKMRNVPTWMQDQVAVADRIIASNADEKLRFKAARSKRDMLIQMSAIRLQGIEKQMMAFCESLVKDRAPSLVRLGLVTQLRLKSAMLVSGANVEVDEIVDAVATLLEDPSKDEELFEAAVEAGSVLQETKHEQEALTIFRSVLKQFADSKSERVEAMLPQLAQLTQLFELGLDAKRDAVLAGDPEANEQFQTAVAKALEGKPGAVVVQRLMDTARDFEHRRNDAMADHLYAALGEAVTRAEDPNLSEAVTKVIEMRKRRSGLLGSILDITGKSIEGQPFDWKAYEGKIVLVDFWATWCGPCLAEMPNIKRNYDRYHDKGFEVVGVNLDRQKQLVDRFFANQTLPWTTVVDADGIADKCGVESIPFVLLIGRDGRVIDMNVRGESLGARLAELFGDDGGDAAADPAKPPAAPGKPAPGKSSSWRPLRSNIEIGLTSTESYVAQRDTAPTKARPASASGTRIARATKTKDPTTKGAVTAEDAQDEPAASKIPEGNPYAPSPSLTPAQLSEFIQKMLDKPKTIQGRPGFVDAIVIAADRILDGNADEKTQLVAIQAKLDVLHKKASDGDSDADEKLVEFVNSIQDDKRPQVARQVKFLQLERKVIDADNLPVDQIPALLAEVKEYSATQKLEARHVRLASNTVRVINRLENDDQREKYFAEFGGLFAKSSDKELARYGRKLAKSPEKKESELVGKPLELAGLTVDGQPLNWDAYRGKVVIVDFWATWCGPCIRELPNVKATYEKHNKDGLDIVGISLDEDLGALSSFLEKNPIPWSTVAGEGTQALAQKYGVRGIPTMMLVDKEGKVVAVSHRIEELAPKLAKLLGK